MQLENGVSDDFKWHGSWSGHGIEVDRGIRLCGDCSPLFYIFVPGIWDSCGTDQKGNVWTGGDKLPGGEKNEYGQFLKFEFLTKAPIDLEALDTRFMDDADIERLNMYHKDVYKTISPYMNEEEKEWLKHVTREISR